MALVIMDLRWDTSVEAVEFPIRIRRISADCDWCIVDLMKSVALGKIIIHFTGFPKKADSEGLWHRLVLFAMRHHIFKFRCLNKPRRVFADFQSLKMCLTAFNLGALLVAKIVSK